MGLTGTSDAKGPNLATELGVGRVLATVGVLMAALVLQSTLLPLATLLGVIPQLVLIVVVSFAYLDGERVGVVTGFVAGLWMDLLVPDVPVGIYALLYTLIGYGVA